MAAVAPLDDVPVSNDYVQIGDVVFLEDDRFIGSPASAARRTPTPPTPTPATASDPLVSSCRRRCSSCSRMERGPTSHRSSRSSSGQGLTMEEGKVSTETPHLTATCCVRRSATRRSVAQRGRDLRFGMVIQLLHHVSSKHLSTSRQPSLAGVGNKVVLDELAGESGCFRVRPRLRVHNEGDKVHTGDPVVLEEVVTGQRLHVRPAAARGRAGAPLWHRGECGALQFEQLVQDEDLPQL